MPTKDRPEDRENATIGEQRELDEKHHEETRKRKQDGTARHGKPPGIQGLADDEPFGQRRHHERKHEGISNPEVPGHFQPVDKERRKDEEEG